eukprot:5786047-Prymnesium_polylepis.1
MVPCVAWCPSCTGDWRVRGNRPPRGRRCGHTQIRGGCEHVLPDTQEGTVPHQDRPARIPWSVCVSTNNKVCIMLARVHCAVRV